jgi:ComF family protein
LSRLAQTWPQRLPTLCAVCHSWGRQRVCGRCTARFSLTKTRCLRCALEIPSSVAVCGACIIDPPPYIQTLTAVDYAYPWDGLITRFKFHAALDLAAVLSQHMLQALSNRGCSVPTLLIPMPLSHSRLRERGYNQAWELTRRLAHALKCPSDTALLLRVKDTPHQISLPRERRAANVRAAFAVEPHRLADIRDQSITLVDDVMTTGATAAEAARALLQSGASEVKLWVLARTPHPRDT